MNGLPRPPAQSLTYATPRTDARIIFTRQPGSATVVIHRPERRAKTAAKATGDLLGEGLLYLIFGIVLVAWIAPVWLLVVIPAAAAIVGCTYGIAWICLARLSRPIVIELTPTELILVNLDGRRRVTIDLEGVYAIYYVSHAKNIFVRRRGKEMCDFFATADEAESQRIADFLRDAAGLGPHAPEAKVATDQQLKQ